MRIATTTTMTNLLNKHAKNKSLKFKYMTMSFEEYKHFVDMDYWQAEDYGDYNWQTGKYRAIAVLYPNECYALPRYLSSKDLNKMFKNANVKTADEFAELVIENVEI